MAIDVLFNPINSSQWSSFDGNRYQATSNVIGMSGSFILDVATVDPALDALFGPDDGKDFVLAETAQAEDVVITGDSFSCRVQYRTGITCQQIVDEFNSQLGFNFLSLSNPVDASFTPSNVNHTLIFLTTATSYGMERIGIFGQDTSIFLINPERIFILGGNKDSQLSVPDLSTLTLSTIADISLVSSDWANTKWASRGWTSSDLSTLKSEIKTWIVNNFDSRPVINVDNNDLDLIMMRGIVGDQDSTVAFALFGNQGSNIPVVVQRAISALMTPNATIFLDVNGLVWSVGSNINGLLGINVAGDVTSPVSVVGGRSYSQIAVSNSSAAALEIGTGNLYSWGQNSTAQLGINTTAAASSPTSVVGGRSFTKVAMGSDAMYALDSSGFAWSTGTNAQGQLGTGDTISRSSPVSVVGGKSYKEIAGGLFFGCAIEGSSGAVYCWGFDGSGELGNNDNTVQQRSSPVSVVGGRSFTKLAIGGEAVLAIEGSTGNLYGWGHNTFGELGIGNISNQISPNSVLSNRSFLSVACGGTTTAAIDGNNDLWVWGQNGFGQFGSGFTGSPASIPTRGASPKKFASVSVEGNGAVTAIELSTGIVYSWGHNQNGYLGIGPVTRAFSSPTSVSSISYRRIAAAGSYSMATYPDGNTVSWGGDSGSVGLLGDGAASSALTPVSVSGGLSFSKITAGQQSVVGLVGNALYSWGGNGVGQLGLGSTISKSTPTLIASPITFSDIGTGTNFSVALDILGFAWTWGIGNSGQLGRNSTASASTPVSVIGGRSFTTVCAGASTSYAIEGSTGRVYSWGSNSQGALGNSGSVNTSSPVLVQQVRSYSKISASTTTHVVALEASTGFAYAWGVGSNGQLGQNSNQNRSAPVPVTGSRSYSALTTGQSFTVAIEGSTGLAWSWGVNSTGQLGNGTTSVASTPVSVSGGRSYSAVAAGSNHCLAIEASTGVIWGWGSAVEGELGNGQAGYAFSPVSVTHLFNL